MCSIERLFSSSSSSSLPLFLLLLLLILPLLPSSCVIILGFSSFGVQRDTTRDRATTSGVARNSLSTLDDLFRDTETVSPAEEWLRGEKDCERTKEYRNSVADDFRCIGSMTGRLTGTIDHPSWKTLENGTNYGETRIPKYRSIA